MDEESSPDSCLLFHIPVQEGHDLTPRTSVIRGEMGGIRSVGDAFSDCPQHRGVIVFAAAHIHEGIGAACRSRRVLEPVQEGHYLTSRTAIIRPEGRR